MAENDQIRLKDRLVEVQDRIQKAAIAAGRNPSDIELIVVTKKKSAVVIKDLVALGINSIGESYLKEALFKKELLQDLNINWHMIGVLQRGKVKNAVEGFCQIHSVDGLELAKEIQSRARDINKIMPLYLELNVSEEITKHGWKYNSEVEKNQFITEVGQILHFDSIEVKGLMTMAPYSSDPENSRQYFRKLRKIKDQLVNHFDNVSHLGLSMGMSGDYEVAIEEGATALRIGSAIVGER